MAVNDFAAARGTQAAAGHCDPGDLGLGADDAEQAAGRRYAADGPLACRVCKSAGKGIGPIANGNPVIIYRNVITHLGIGVGMAAVDVVGKPVQLFLIINQILIVVEIGHRAIGAAFAAGVIMIVDNAVHFTTIDNIAIGGALGEVLRTDGLSPTGRCLVLRQAVGHFAAFERINGSVFQVAVVCTVTIRIGQRVAEVNVTVVSCKFAIGVANCARAVAVIDIRVAVPAEGTHITRPAYSCGGIAGFYPYVGKGSSAKAANILIAGKVGIHHAHTVNAGGGIHNTEQAYIACIRIVEVQSGDGVPLSVKFAPKIMVNRSNGRPRFKAAAVQPAAGIEHVLIDGDIRRQNGTNVLLGSIDLVCKPVQVGCGGKLVGIDRDTADGMISLGWLRHGNRQHRHRLPFRAAQRHGQRQGAAAVGQGIALG